MPRYDVLFGGAEPEDLRNAPMLVLSEPVTSWLSHMLQEQLRDWQPGRMGSLTREEATGLLMFIEGFAVGGPAPTR